MEMERRKEGGREGVRKERTEGAKWKWNEGKKEGGREEIWEQTTE